MWMTGMLPLGDLETLCHDPVFQHSGPKTGSRPSIPGTTFLKTPLISDFKPHACKY